MTSRRWQQDAADDDIGPTEMAVRAELATLGWVPGVSEGTKLGTLAAQALNLAETFDRTQAVNSAIVSKELTVTMELARTAARGVKVEGTDEFTTRRLRRGAPGGAAEAAPEDPAALPE